MLSDIEELAREGMREFTATIHASPDLAARIYQQHRRRHTVYASAAAAVGAAGAAAVAVGVALTVSPASTPGSSDHPTASHPTASHAASGPGIQLAAWTVTRQTDGNIKITFRKATDVPGLQRTLRADGVPASVILAGQQNSACQPFSGSQAFWPFGKLSGPFGGKGLIHNPKEAFSTPYALVIDPSRVPSGAGVQIVVSGTPGAADNFELNARLVTASPQCTGS